MYFITCPVSDCNARKQEYSEIKEELTEEQIDDMLWILHKESIACFCVQDKPSLADVVIAPV